MTASLRTGLRQSLKLGLHLPRLRSGCRSRLGCQTRVVGSIDGTLQAFQQAVDLFVVGSDRAASANEGDRRARQSANPSDSARRTRILARKWRLRPLSTNQTTALLI